MRRPVKPSTGHSDIARTVSFSVTLSPPEQQKKCQEQTRKGPLSALGTLRPGIARRHLALNYIFSGALFAFQFDFNVLLASLTVWVNNTNCLAIHLHQKPPFSMIDTGGSANRTINVNLHSMDDSFRSLAPLPSLATARRRMCASRLDCHTCVIWICHMVLYPIRYR